jgi:putative transposase
LRKNRKGAFWEDRFHATAIGSDDHLFRCITYINLNMVRAGVVNDPMKWEHSGYFEIQNSCKRNDIIDYGSLLSLLNLKSIDQLKAAQQERVTDALIRNDLKRDRNGQNRLLWGMKLLLRRSNKDKEQIKKSIDAKLGIRYSVF